MARRLLPTAIVIPCVLGYVRILGQKVGLFETEIGVALMVLITVILLVTAIVVTAGELNRSDRAKRFAEQAIRELNESLERRVAERTAELALANRDLAEKNRENEMFVFSVSHDLRSPLVNLEGFSNELDTDGQELKELFADPAIPPAVQHRFAVIQGNMGESIRFIRQAVLRLSNIIDALLRLSRAGRVEYQPREFELREIVELVVGALHSTIAHHGATVTVNDLPVVCGDKTAIEWLFANLIGNALKYLDPQRAGVIEVGCCPDHSTATSGFVVLYVKDNGLGIAPEYHDKIFQPFQRVHGDVAPGEGMGLAIVRRILERHQGKIWVESAGGHGSTFFLELPAGNQASRREPAVTPSTHDSVEEHGVCRMSL